MTLQTLHNKVLLLFWVSTSIVTNCSYWSNHVTSHSMRSPLATLLSPRHRTLIILCDIWTVYVTQIDCNNKDAGVWNFKPFEIQAGIIYKLFDPIFGQAQMTQWSGRSKEAKAQRKKKSLEVKRLIISYLRYIILEWFSLIVHSSLNLLQLLYNWASNEIVF